MNNGFDIRSLPEEMKRKLIDYITDLPSDIAFSVKMTLNDPEMDPSLWRDKNRILSRFSTVAKYLSDKCNIISRNKATGSFYQEEYCKIMEKIEMMIPNKRGDLLYLMKIPCYDVGHLLIIEKEIANIISKSGDDAYDADMIAIICREIIPYKLMALNINQRVCELMNGFHATESNDYPPILHIHNMIMMLIDTHNNSFVNLYNIAVLIYIYFKMFFIDLKLVNAYDLFNRFSICIESYGGDSSVIKDTFNQLLRYKPALSIADAASKLHGINLHTNFENDDTAVHAVDSPNIRRINNYVFFIKDASILDNLDNDLTSIIIKKTTIDFIAHCMNTDRNAITFYISENDIGHITNACKSQVGTVTDIFDKTITNIIYYKNELYILFTDYTNRGSVYGINIPQNSVDNRKILEVKKDKSIQYKFVSII